MTVTWDFSFNKLEKDLAKSDLKPNLLQVGEANIKEVSTKKQTKKDKVLIEKGKQAKENEITEPTIATIPGSESKYWADRKALIAQQAGWNWG